MATDPVVIGPDAAVAEAARRMVQHGVKRLPVVDGNGELVGVVSRADLVTILLRSDEDIRAEIIDEVLVHLLRLNPAEVEVEVEVEVTVIDGVVTLTGTVEDRRTGEAVQRLVRRVDGVVDVRSVLSHRLACAHPTHEPRHDNNRGRAT